MAELDPESVTLEEVLDSYNTDPTRKNKAGKMPGKRSIGPILGEHANKPLLELFTPDEKGATPIREIIKKAQKGVLEGKVAASSLKNAMQTIRYLSVHLAKNGYEGDAPSFLITENSPKAAETYFGLKEPPKAVSSINVNPDADVRKQFIKGLIKHGVNNPDDVPAVRAILFQMSTGLRPNAVLGLRVDQYKVHPKTGVGSIYIEGDVEGAKGQKISTGINSTADAQIQSQLALHGSQVKDAKGLVFVNAKGKPLETKDINRVLAQIKVPDLLFDDKSGKYYDSFKPSDKDAKSSKFGAQLLRNYHTSVGRSIGVNDLLLAKMQGRSTKSYGKGSTGELSTYDTKFPHIVSPYEAEQYEIISHEYRRGAQEAIDELRAEGFLPEEAKVDFGQPVAEGQPAPKRIGQTTEGWTEYFDRPMEESGIIEGEATVVTEPEGPKKLTDADNEGIKKKFLSLFKKAPVPGKGAVQAGMTLLGGYAVTQDVEAAQEISEMKDTDAASQQAAELGLSMTPGAFVQMGAETLMPSFAEDLKEEAETMTEEEFLGGFAADTFED